MISGAILQSLGPDMFLGHNEPQTPRGESARNPPKPEEHAPPLLMLP